MDLTGGRGAIAESCDDTAKGHATELDDAGPHELHDVGMKVMFCIEWPPSPMLYLSPVLEFPRYFPFLFFVYVCIRKRHDPETFTALTDPDP